MLATTPTRYKSPYSPRVTSLRQQVIAGHPATRASPSSLSNGRQPARVPGQLGDSKKKGERRVSEATINHRPPLPPPSISGRSQSLDGLLDDGDDDGDEGASDVVDGRLKMKKGEAMSLEVLLDENETPMEQPEKVLRPPRREERSKSVDNYLGERREGFDSLPRTRSPSEQFCERETLVVDEAKEKKAHDMAYDSEEEGPRVMTVVEEPESGTPSSMSRQNSTTSSELPERKKTFINRLGKRVRSMIKK